MRYELIHLIHDPRDTEHATEADAFTQAIKVYGEGIIDAYCGSDRDWDDAGEGRARKLIWLTVADSIDDDGAKAVAEILRYPDPDEEPGDSREDMFPYPH